MSYYEVPAEVLEAQDQLKEWATKALAAASRKRPSARRVRKTVRILSALSVAALVTVLLSGCTGYGRMFLESYTNPLDPQVFMFSDGSQSLAYHVNFSSGKETDTVLFFIGGSGCNSYKYYLRRYLEDLSGNREIFALQKRGVSDRTTGMFGCSETFYKKDHFTQWVADQREFVGCTLDAMTVKPRAVLLFGVSEGATVAAAVAAEEPRITHLAIIGSGGMKQVDELRTLAKKRQFPPTVDDEYGRIMAEPQSISKRVWGQTYRYWSSVLDRDALEYYSRLSIPILVGMGEKDTSAPVEAAYVLRDRFRELGKTNLTLVVYPGADHRLAARDKSFGPDFFRTLQDWLRKG